MSANFDDYVKRSQWGFGRFDANDPQKLLEVTPILEWNADLPLIEDYKQRTEKLPAPATLKPGFYFIVASPDRTFREKENQVRGVAEPIAPTRIDDNGRFRFSAQGTSCCRARRARRLGRFEHARDQFLRGQRPRPCRFANGVFHRPRDLPAWADN